MHRPHENELLPSFYDSLPACVHFKVLCFTATHKRFLMGVPPPLPNMAESSPYLSINCHLRNARAITTDCAKLCISPLIKRWRMEQRGHSRRNDLRQSETLKAAVATCWVCGKWLWHWGRLEWDFGSRVMRNNVSGTLWFYLWYDISWCIYLLQS